MPFVSSCCCPHHDEWKHGAVDSNHLRQWNRGEAEMRRNSVQLIRHDFEIALYELPFPLSGLHFS